MASADRLLITECIIGEGDEFVAAGMRFVLVFDIDSSIESIWKTKGVSLSRYASESLDSSFVVRGGGAWQMTLASDIRRAMRRLDFRFIDTKFPPPIDALSSEPEQCNFDYSGLKEYEFSKQAMRGNDSDR